MKIENNISVNIDEEVALALLGIDEALNLIALVKVVRLSTFESLLVLGAWESRLNLRLVVLVRVLEA